MAVRFWRESHDLGEGEGRGRGISIGSARESLDGMRFVRYPFEMRAQLLITIEKNYAERVYCVLI